MLKLALVESGAFVQMDRQMAASIEARHNECNRQLLAAAETLDSVLASCDGFIDADARLRASNLRVRLESEQRALAIRIESERKALALKSYRQDFSALTASSSTEQLVKFIDTYSRQDDPDRLVPKVRAMLDERRRQADLELAQQKQQQTLRDLEARIAQCKRMIAQARTSKEREQTMAAASGYVKPEVLRQAAAVEFDCTPVINDSYRRYRSLGGTRSQEEIQ
jgi:hypothetical protein